MTYYVIKTQLNKNTKTGLRFNIKQMITKTIPPEEKKYT